MEQIIRMPYKYSELFETMNNEECGKLIKGLFKKDKTDLKGLTLTYYNIIIVDIINIENQVNAGRKGGNKGGRPKKKTLGDKKEKTPPIGIKKPNIKESNIKEYKITKDNIVSSEIATTKVVTLQEIIKETFDKDFKQELDNKYKLSDEDFKEQANLFYLHWTEKNVNGKKERWEKEKTFNPKLRFYKWLSNNQQWNKKPSKVSKSYTSVF